MLQEFAEGASGTRLFYGDVDDIGEVVVKVIPRPSSASELRKRRGYFEDEVECGRVLESPYIRTMYEAGEITEPVIGYLNGVFYLVFEKLECTLLDKLNDKLPTHAEVRDIAWAIGNGLVTAHSRPRPIVHRDLKPSNILLEDGIYALAKVADFGIARQEGGTQLTTGLWVGTADYMAPEQFERDARPAPSLDIYAFGLVIWECLTGVVLGAEADPMLTRRNRQGGDLSARLEIGKAGKLQMEAALLSCLRVAPTRRPPTIEEAMKAILRAGAADRVWKLSDAQAAAVEGRSPVANDLSDAVEDLRSKGGALWVYLPRSAESELVAQLPGVIFAYSDRRAGWWTKKPDIDVSRLHRLAHTIEAKPKKTKKTNAAFLEPLRPDRALGAIVGNDPLPRTEITKRVWAYIKEKALQDRRNRRMINADARLAPVFNGKRQVSMFEMANLVNQHLSSTRKE